MERKIKSLNESFKKNKINEKKLEEFSGGDCPLYIPDPCPSLSPCQLLWCTPLLYGLNCT